MNVLVCVMAAKCPHLFSVLTSGPVTVGGQRGTCGGPEVKTDVCIGLEGHCFSRSSASKLYRWSL
jgi:hypothetical protein